jgi:hypothetical protein
MFAFGKNHIRSQATGNTEHSEFANPLWKTATCSDDMFNEYVGEFPAARLSLLHTAAVSFNENDVIYFMHFGI